MTRDGSTWCSPKERTPGVSTTQPRSPGSGSARAEVVVCRPRPVTALTLPVVRRRSSGTRALTSVVLPTPECPTKAVTLPSSSWRTRSAASPFSSSSRLVTMYGTPSGVYASSSLSGDARSDLVSTSSGVSPPSYAATRQRSIMRGRGSGSASAVTIASWSALATTTRSYGSSSSAVRRSTVRRGAIRTIRARVSFSPERSPTMETVSPTTAAFRPSSRAFIATTVRPSTRQVVEPRSTVRTMPSSASSCLGRMCVRGRLPLRLGRTRMSSSSGFFP